MGEQFPIYGQNVKTLGYFGQLFKYGQFCANLDIFVQIRETLGKFKQQSDTYLMLNRLNEAKKY